MNIGINTYRTAIAYRLHLKERAVNHFSHTFNLLIQIFLLILLVGFPQNSFTHQSGHNFGSSLTEWHLTDGRSIRGSILIINKDEVLIETIDHHIQTVSIQSLSTEDRNFILKQQQIISQINNYTPSAPTQLELVSGSMNTANTMIDLFEKFNNVTARIEGNYLRVSSYGIPEHPMMTGITNWQQQVPVPQDYTGSNSWSIPLNPQIADKTIYVKDRFLRGAIALAVNGVPIFTAQNNRGEFAQSIGELDKWGGHSGRADDYHYHLPPVHLQEKVGKDNPIAYAFDGFPIYGATDKPLDDCLGQFNEDGSYAYYTIETEPYFIAGIKGKVNIRGNIRDGEIVPQAKSTPVRTGDYRPLRGASIVSFSGENNTFSLEYTLGSAIYTISWSSNSNALYTFTYTSPGKSPVVEKYRGNVSIQKSLH